MKNKPPQGLGKTKNYCYFQSMTRSNIEDQKLMSTAIRPCGYIVQEAYGVSSEESTRADNVNLYVLCTQLRQMTCVTTEWYPFVNFFSQGWVLIFGWVTTKKDFLMVESAKFLPSATPNVNNGSSLNLLSNIV